LHTTTKNINNCDCCMNTSTPISTPCNTLLDYIYRPVPHFFFPPSYTFPLPIAPLSRNLNTRSRIWDPAGAIP
jgi:hypothetical protein